MATKNDLIFKNVFLVLKCRFAINFKIMSLLLGRNLFGDENNSGNTLTKEAAKDLLNEWVKNPRLKLHMKQIAHLMHSWARERENLTEEEAWKWELAGLLHDADWDQWPELHCKKIIAELESKNIDPEIIHAIASHGPAHFGVEPETKMDKMLYAFDELSGLIHAYSLMRPTGYAGMDVKGVKKRLKEKPFAANVSREDINDACSRAGIDADELIEFIVAKQPTVQE
jgi:predicted hydrolase (HD superfamily)